MTMTTFKQYSIASAPVASKSALHDVEKALGFVPNLFATLAESPVALQGYVTLDAILATGSFTAAERQIIQTAVSAANGCAYCVAAHSTLANTLRAADDAIAAARGEGMAADPRTDALVHFTHAVVRSRGHIARVELEAFLGAGFKPAHALEVVAHVGLKTISNYVDGFARIPLDEAFQEHRWQPTSEAA
jgi:uncharacterized peroxidase-related enzyme